MSLLDQAVADAATFLADANDFARPIIVTSPEGVRVAVMGYTTDIGESIDPDTGTMVSGRTAIAVVSTAALVAAGVSLPRGEYDATRRPWSMSFAGASGVERSYKVLYADPDDRLGVNRFTLEDLA